MARLQGPQTTFATQLDRIIQRWPCQTLRHQTATIVDTNILNLIWTPAHSRIHPPSVLAVTTPLPQVLSFPLHSPPLHWAACVTVVDIAGAHVRFGDPLRKRRPQALFDELLRWLQDDIGLKNVKITEDLPCGLQHDVVNCGIISANTLAHAILGDAMWDNRRARTHRYQAFCTIASTILRSQEFKGDSAVGLLLESPDSEPTARANVEMPTTTSVPSAIAAPGAPAILKAQSEQFTEEDIASLLDDVEEWQQSVPAKRLRKDVSDSDDEIPAKKRTKKIGKPAVTPRSKAPQRPDQRSIAPTIPARPREAPPRWLFEAQNRRPLSTKWLFEADFLRYYRHFAAASPASLDCPERPMLFFRTNLWWSFPGPIPATKATLPEYVQLEILESMRSGGQGHSSKHDRLVGVLIKHALYRGNPAKLEKLRKECKRDGDDPQPGLDINNPKQIQCSRCHKFVQLKAVYEAGRFRDHWEKGCKKAAAPSAVHPRIEYYIDHCPTTGAGACQINFYVVELFKEKRGIVSISDPRLSQDERALAYHRQALDRDWRIETSPHRSSVVAARCLITFTVYREVDVDDNTVVCTACWDVYLRKEFRTAINRKRDKTYAQLKCTPKLYSNPIQTRLMAQYQGLEELLAERSPLGVFLRFARGVAFGHYKDFKVFLGLVETMVMATERRIRGVGMQNFKYPPEFREFGALIRMMSPRTYRTMAQHFRLESERSLQHRASQRPRFPLGFTEQSFEALARYCQDYGYPSNYPLCFSVDDTKLFPAMQPLYDGPTKSWYLVGLPGEQQLRPVGIGTVPYTATAVLLRCRYGASRTVAVPYQSPDSRVRVRFHIGKRRRCRRRVSAACAPAPPAPSASHRRRRPTCAPAAPPVAHHRRRVSAACAARRRPPVLFVPPAGGGAGARGQPRGVRGFGGCRFGAHGLRGRHRRGQGRTRVWRGRSWAGGQGRGFGRVWRARAGAG
ncbi:hypothetical protein GGX14DRAFT_586935 [Mycena pura]|uniref:Ubiquitin-like protease family profile domain-containing protein n=1 Tax=Mycena pura TaxID=153505 RepID=A0AAD6UWL2_9AGAR|nr:hypothetical protein GGX14DRAFT_586935 [Mycena pura]